MAAIGPARPRRPDWTELGSAAVDHGDLEAARRCFAEAVRRAPGSARARYHLAVVEEGLGNLDAAGAGFTEALRRDPAMTDAARRLALLAGRCDLPGAVPLNAAGLRAALGHATVDREPIAEMAVRHLAVAGPLGAALAKGRAAGWDAAARELCLRATAPLLRDALLLDVLRTGVFRGPDMERLLTALRRIALLELPPHRLGERRLLDFVLALAQQCQINEHVWHVGSEELDRLEALAIDRQALLAGDTAAGHRLLLAALYRPLLDLLGGALNPNDMQGIRPTGLRDVVTSRLAEAADERARMARLPRLGIIADATSRRVARHYEASPYPRWTSVGVIAPKDMRRALRRYFGERELKALDRPLEVLVAGCGTGQQAVQTALAYGPQARVLAVDLSAPSLAYAARMAERLGAGNVTFVQADLLTLCEQDARLAGHFDVIECTGVLHHLADPFAGWSALLKCLAGGTGIMLVGLYSAIARRGITALRTAPDYPGSDCSDAAARAFRQVLLERPPGAAGADLRVSRDFYTMSNYRDLVLHVSERPVTLPEIAGFLAANGLAFRGFQLDRAVFPGFLRMFPGAAWPGTLAQWTQFEEAYPHTFSGMYNFWCAWSG